MSTALQLKTDTASLMPAMSVQDAVERYGQLVQFVSTLLKADIDYGQIPGTNKPTLLKPGAEKLLTFFGLSKHFRVLEKVEDWTGREHQSEPFFYYMYRCALYNGDHLIAESDGSCNSFESKYRYRKAERQCPACGKAAIIKGKEEYGGGWLCFKKKDGCGAKFRDGDAAIESQQAGRVVNPDIADQVNTIQKMAQKRALIAATLLAVNASEFFTQDLEDMVIEAEVVREPEPVRTVKLEGAQPTTKPIDPREILKSLNYDLGYDDAALLKWLVKKFNLNGDITLRLALASLGDGELSQAIDIFREKLENGGKK